MTGKLIERKNRAAGDTMPDSDRISDNQMFEKLGAKVQKG